MNEIKIVIEGMKELTEAINGLAMALARRNAEQAPAGTVPQPCMNLSPQQAPMNQPAAQIPQQPYTNPAPQTVPVTQVPVQPMQPASVPLSGAAPSQGMVPTTASVQAYTIEQLQVAAAGLTGMGKMPQVMGILQSFGIQAMTELPKERYSEFAAALREAGAQI